VTYTSSRILIDTLVGGSSTGCDSVITTNLTINNSTTSSVALTSCGSSIVNGKLYTSSQLITDTLTNAFGCDSIVITNLTINSGINSTSLINGILMHQENPVEGGIVKLIRKDGNTPQLIFEIDSAISSSDGSFEFKNVPHGDYLIKAKVDNDLYPNIVSTYNGFTNHWQKASVVSIACSDSITGINLNMINFPATLGYSNIIGNINTLGLSNAILNEIEISLEKMPEGSLISGTTIDSNGDFVFENIELGEYRIIIDMFGFNIDTNSMLRIINSIVELDMNFCVNEEDAVIEVCEVLKTKRIKSSKNTEFKVSPNPAHSTINFESINSLELFSITITNSTGQKIYFEENISNEFSVQLNGYAKGVYYFFISSENGFEIGNFIKK
jgi:hypothetical protein